MVDLAFQQYVQTRSADAFRALVDRHGKTVYAQCVRELRDKHLAEDVTQAVFMVLARKSATLPADVVLPAWLFKVTHFACANAKRDEMRRRRHEQEAAMTRELECQQSASVVPSDLELVVDGALARLGRADREAIILRFYAGMNSTEVGESLGMSADTTRRRISRALEKLRRMLAGTNAGLTPALLLAGMTEISRSAALPAEVLNRMVIHTLDPTTATWSQIVANRTMQIMKWAKIKVRVAAVLAIVAAGAVGAAVSGALNQPAAAPQATAAPAPASAQIAIADEAAVDRELIRLAASRFAQAIRAHDVKALEQAMIVSNDADGALVKAMILENLAYRHLQDAWAAKLKGPVTINGLSFVWIPQLDGGAEAALEVTLANLRDADIQITGNTVRFPLKLVPAGAKVPPGLSYMHNWWVGVVNDGMNWKLDMSRTLRFNVTFTFSPGRQPLSSEQEMKLAIDHKAEIATILEDGARAIETGALTSADAAGQKVQGEVSAMHKRLGLTGINYRLNPGMPVSNVAGN